jgi:hypothetical protein
MLILPHFFTSPPGFCWGFGAWGLPHDPDSVSCHLICYGQMSYATTDRKPILAMCSIGKRFGCASQRLTILQQSRTYIGD